MNTQKYIDMVHHNPAGAALLQRVDDAWPQWVNTVEQAPWLRSWRKRLNTVNSKGEGVEILARRIFFSGVWGYGWELWQPATAGRSSADGCGGRPAQPMKSKTRRDGALACLANLQGVGGINKNRTWVWDPEFLEAGEFVPCEFAAMDRWLESLLCL